MPIVVEEKRAEGPSKAEIARTLQPIADDLARAVDKLYPGIDPVTRRLTLLLFAQRVGVAAAEGEPVE